MGYSPMCGSYQVRVRVLIVSGGSGSELGTGQGHVRDWPGSGEDQVTNGVRSVNVRLSLDVEIALV